VAKGEHHVISLPPVNQAARKAALRRAERGSARVKIPTGKLGLFMANTVIIMKGPTPPGTVVSIDGIPNLVFTDGSTHDMSQYINDPTNARTNTAVNGLSTFATYSSVTELLTGVGVGTETGLTLTVTHPLGVETSNVFEADIIPEAFYVAQNDPAASDSNPGTEASPKLTIGAGIGLMASGDTLIVKAGTYNESLNSLPSGTASNYTTIRANPGDTVILTKSGGSFNRIANFNSSHSFIAIDGFICNDDSGSVLWNAFKYDGSCDHIRLDNCEIYNCQHSGVQDSSEEGVGGHEFLNGSSHDNGIDGLDHGIYMVSPSSITRNSDFYNNTGYGIQLWPTTDNSGCEIQYNRCWSNGDSPTGSRKGGITLNGTNCLIANNLCWDNADSGIICSGGSGNKIFNNTCWANRGFHGSGGIDLNTSGITCRNNISYANVGPDIENSFGSTVSNNLTTDPLFVNENTDPNLIDLKLQAGSDAIGGGVTLADVTDDFDKVARGSPPDIGAYEFV
jgi:hypothetical protein